MASQVKPSIKVWLMGPDETGIVYRIALVIKNHRGSIERLRSMQFAGRFALTLIASFGDATPDDVQAAIAELRRNPLGPAFDIEAEEFLTDKQSRPGNTWIFVFRGPDNIGVVEHLSYQFFKRDINLEAVVAEADPVDHEPMSGTATFKSSFHAKIPDDVDVKAFLKDLEREALQINHKFDPFELP
jgi:glycine cleavage system regulatory protein